MIKPLPLLSIYLPSPKKLLFTLIMLLVLFHSAFAFNARQATQLPPLRSNGSQSAKMISVGKTEILALCYHDVNDDIDADLDEDSMALSTQHLLQQFEWFRANGYQPINFDTLIAAYKGEKKLPAKPVLLTFDDGYASFYEKIFPLLKLYQYPAIFALVTDWLEVPRGKKCFTVRNLSLESVFLAGSKSKNYKLQG